MSGVTVAFEGGPWAGKSTTIDHVTAPVFAVGDDVGNHYWLNTKGEPGKPPTYYWDGTEWGIREVQPECTS